VGFSALIALKTYFQYSISDFIGGGIHFSSTGRFPVSRYLLVHMQGNKAIRTMIPAGPGGLGDFFSAIDADE